MVNSASDYEGFGSGFLSDHSTLFLLFANFIMIFFAIYENWNLLTIMFIYWCQSVIIGVFTFFKILNLKNFSTEGMRFSNGPALPTTGTKIGMAFFFLFHYGFFHFGYFFFLIANPFFDISSQTSFTGLTILIVIVVFFINHLFSFLYNREKDANKKQNIGKVMMFPYIRIIPMHLTIIFGSFFIMAGSPQISLILFLILKTIADVAMHIIEHRESIANKITIKLNKDIYSPGEKITGKLNLEFSRPVKAQSLKVAFIAEKIFTQSSNEESRHYRFYNHEETLDGEKAYESSTYDIILQIPSDLLIKSNDFSQTGPFATAKKYSEKLQKWSINIYLQEYDRFYIKVILDIPMSLDITKTYDVSIS